MAEQTVLVRGGSGTIGLAVVALLARYCHELEISVYFDKQRPDPSHVPDVSELQSLGGQFCVPADQRERFAAAGYEVDDTLEDVLKRAAVVVDCTNASDGNMCRYDQLLSEGQLRRAAANGGANMVHPKGWLFVRGVNDQSFADSRKVGIASCNEHAISAVWTALSACGHLLSMDVVLARRGQDLDKVDKHPPATSVNPHDTDVFGTKHARHVAAVFAPLGVELSGRLTTSSFVVPTPIFHTARFAATFANRVSRDEVLELLRKNPRISFTRKPEANRISAFARNFGFVGRIYAQTIIVDSTLTVVEDGRRALFFAYTPQDANVVLSNVAVVAQALMPERDRYEEFMRDVERALIRKVV